MKITLKKIVALLLTIAIFVVILFNINTTEFLNYFYELNLLFFLISFLFYVPLYLVISIRWKVIINYDYKISMWDSIKMCLAGIGLNSFVPSKLGELSKAYFLKKEGVDIKRAINCVVFEKVLDIFTLCVLFLLGLLTVNKFNYVFGLLIFFCLIIIMFTILYFKIDFLNSPLSKRLFWFLFKHKKIENMIINMQGFVFELKQNKIRLAAIFLLSLLSWLVQLSQIYFLFLSLNYFVPIKLIFSLVPAAILAGLAPLTIGGMGIRDSALIFLFLDYASPSLMAGIGVLLSTRYWVASLIALPFLREYISK
ncbi:flippase-like domain-containing protein [Candidatus Woesearchaeota archaeon]|nr:flippase-like domain-containing protein [Candidatus Woesearchaeota archaeon]